MARGSGIWAPLLTVSRCQMRAWPTIQSPSKANDASSNQRSKWRSALETSSQLTTRLRPMKTKKVSTISQRPTV